MPVYDTFHCTWTTKLSLQTACHDNALPVPEYPEMQAVVALLARGNQDEEENPVEQARAGLHSPQYDSFLPNRLVQRCNLHVQVSFLLHLKEMNVFHINKFLFVLKKN